MNLAAIDTNTKLEDYNANKGRIFRDINTLTATLVIYVTPLLIIVKIE